MSTLRLISSDVLPKPLRRILGKYHRAYVFARSMRRFQRDPGAVLKPGSRLLRALIYGWGNPVWSGLDDFLVAIVQAAQRTRGPILECGSGLSTMLLGVIAQQQGQTVWSLEHMPLWADRVRKTLRRYAIQSVRLCLTQLIDRGDYHWYAPPRALLQNQFALVICDGPPGTTRGGRYGLVPTMRQSLAPGCVILLDDAHREQERDIARRWCEELGAISASSGLQRPCLRVTLPGGISQPPETLMPETAGVTAA